jgi:hypothetical protein
MSAPIFLHVTSDGGLWVSNQAGDTPAGTITATYKINSDAKFQKFGTLSGVVGVNLAATGVTGKRGKEIV